MLIQIKNKNKNNSVCGRVLYGVDRNYIDKYLKIEKKNYYYFINKQNKNQLLAIFFSKSLGSKI